MRTKGRLLSQLMLIILAAAGCSQQDFLRPMGPVRDVFSTGRRRERPAVEGETREQRLAQVLTRWKQQARAAPADYVLGPADELTVSIFALEAPGQTTELQRTIGREGNITLPWIGDVKAAGRTVREIEQAIRDAYEGRYIKNPQVTVTVSAHRSKAVVVTGSVRQPGIYYLTDNRSSVLEMLAKAGGLADDASDELMLIRGSSPSSWTPEEASNVVAGAAGAVPSATVLADSASIVGIDLRELVDNGRLDQNVQLEDGDILTVRSMAQRYVYVLGYVQHPGGFEMKSGQRIDAVRAVAIAGGLAATARAENSFLVRETPEGQKVIPLDLVRMARALDEPLYLQPGDTLVVGSSWLARLSEFIRPTVGAGMQLSPVP